MTRNWDVTTNLIARELRGGAAGPRAAAAAGRGGLRPRTPAIGGDPSRLSAQAKRVRRARTAPPARLTAPLGALFARSVG